MTHRQCADAAIAAESKNTAVSFSFNSMLCPAGYKSLKMLRDNAKADAESLFDNEGESENDSGYTDADSDTESAAEKAERTAFTCEFYSSCGQLVHTCEDFVSGYSARDLKAHEQDASHPHRRHTECTAQGKLSKDGPAGESPSHNMLWAVSTASTHNGRMFMWPPYQIGHTFTLAHVDIPQVPNTSGPQVVTMTTVATTPKVFSIENFVSPAEQEFFLAKYNNSADPLLERSTTGAREQMATFERRTSQSAFDTSSDIAKSLKNRGFSVTSIPVYEEKATDGIQILRYNATNCYVPHHDWMDPAAMPQIPNG